MDNLKVYLVGGAVRDRLMGKEPKDLDYVVVGTTPEKMLERGFKQVGGSFPVFLHPVTGDEYALARTEVKNGVGYQGFDCYFGPEVSLEEDLARRDLTINSMAIDIDDKYNIIDPFNGQEDLKNKILRPTTSAFCQDPLRVFRTCRFLAHMPEFKLHDTFFEYAEIAAKEFKHLPAERIWKETEKALAGEKPSLYFRYMMHYDVFSEIREMVGIPQPPKHHPEGDVYIHTMLCVDLAARVYKDPMVTFAALVHDFGKASNFHAYGNLHGHESRGVPIVSAFCAKYKVPNNFKELGEIVCEEHTRCHSAFDLKPASILNLIKRTKAETNMSRFIMFLSACEMDASGRGQEYDPVSYQQANYLRECLEEIKGVDTKAISAKGLHEGHNGLLIGENIYRAKLNAVKRVQARWKQKTLKIL
jgi:tRNA nucleotidyltransferase (CCA-adding enzyme)